MSNVKAQPPSGEQQDHPARSLNLNTPVGQLVAERPARARVFERFGIDYCCGGRQPLAEASAARGLDPELVAAALRESDAEPPAADERNWSQAGLAELADHIEATHHAWLRAELPRLAGLAAKVADVHGPRHPEYVESGQVRVINSPLRLVSPGQPHPPNWLSGQLYRILGMGYLLQ